MVRDNVEDHAEPGFAETAELVLAAELLRDGRRVDDVVPVRGAALRLHHRREVEVADPELSQIGDELAGAPKVEMRAELEPVGRAELGHYTRRSSTIERDSTSTSPRADQERISPPAGSAVESSSAQRDPKRRGRSWKRTGS